MVPSPASSSVDVQNAPMNRSVLLFADAQNLPIGTGTTQCVVTSPPYLHQRVYGSNPNEIGNEPTVEAFVEALVRASGEVRRILRPDGLYFLNLGEKSNGSGGAGGDYNPGGSKEGKPRYGRFLDPSFAAGQFLNIPGRVVAGLQDDGWRLRQTIIWSKGVETRESIHHVNRPRTSHEFIFMLQPNAGRAKFHHRVNTTGSVWSFAPSKGNGHQAAFPEELPLRCIWMSTDPGDLVVDPFAGSGTTLRAATLLGRRAIGVDLYAGEQ